MTWLLDRLGLTPFLAATAILVGLAVGWLTRPRPSALPAATGHALTLLGKTWGFERRGIERLPLLGDRPFRKRLTAELRAGRRS